jgi:hypothetical protein
MINRAEVEQGPQSIRTQCRISLATQSPTPSKGGDGDPVN